VSSLRSLFLTSALFAAAACSDPDGEMLPPGVGDDFQPPGPTAGTRLVPQYVESADNNTRRFLQLIDLLTDQPCFLSRKSGSDPVVTCRPRASGMPVFLDSSCTRRYLETSFGNHTWISSHRVVRRGERLEPQPVERYIEYSPGRCAPMPAAPFAPIYEIAEELPEDQVASGRIVVDDGDPRLSVHTFEGDDGSRVLYQIIDRLAGVECLPHLTNEGMRCAPDTTRELHDEGLLDTNCDRLAVLEYGGHGVARVIERGGEVYRFEPVLEFGSVRIGRRAADGSCTVEEMHAGKKTLHFGVPYPEREWPSLAMHELGDTTLSAVVATVPSGVRAEPVLSLDTNSMFESGGAPCGPMWIVDSLRCVPAVRAPYVHGLVRYADARCSERLISLDTDGEVPREVAIREPGAPYPLDHLPHGGVHQVGDELIDRPVYELIDLHRRECRPLPDPRNRRHFRAGPALPAARFPELWLR
jgi:hypothetical protein